jgi:hypothetical protein
MIKRSLFAFLLMLVFQHVFGQFKSDFIVKKIAVADTVQVDTLSILPKSVRLSIAGQTVDTAHYKIILAASQIIWLKKPAVDSVQISYRVFPILLTKKYAHKNPELIVERTISGTKPFIYSLKNSDNTVFNFSGFDKSGSISRSIGFGNNQNLTVNSNMVLQLSGKLNNDIEILAAISDDNLPIQPEGNTQQLNDFDKVFIQLKRKKATFIAGDYELRKPDSYFMNYYKRTQGAYLSNIFSDKKQNTYTTQIAGAVAKGRSARNIIAGIEGNQGPYRLTGNNGEQFIIVLSGTERVFVDGVLLLRGQDNDYIIDYNTSELTFTTKRLITQNSRIIVEFEYSDKVFARSLFYVNQNFESKKLKVGFNFYNEQDNPNQPYLQDLSDPQKDFLKTIGNNIGQAVYSNANIIPFNKNEILYRKIDTLGVSNVYVYSTDSLLAKYRVGFSFLGTGKGNYRLKTNAIANGRVFEFVSPLNNMPQGDYEPVTLLITPKKQQLVTLNANYKLSKRTNIYTETAFSNNDLNLFSTIGDSQNKGLAYKLIVDNTKLLSGNDSSGLKLNSKISYEYTNKLFKPLERYRPVEFERDFNLIGTPNVQSNENWTTAQVQLYKSPLRQVLYKISNFTRGSSYFGLQQTFDGNYAYKTNSIAYTASLLNSKTDQTQKGDFLKQYFKYLKKFKGFETGFNFEQEQNQTKSTITNIYSPQSFAYRQYQFLLQNAQPSVNRFSLGYTTRFDDLPVGDKLKSFSKGDIFTAKAEFNKNPNSILAINATYRTVKYVDKDSLKGNEQTLLGRIDYNFKALRGFINFTSFYELGTGQEPKREFTYLEVPAGQGVYAWNDYNNNGIKELNEFEISRFPDQAKFIRIYTTTNQFIPSSFTGINQNLTLNAATLFKKNNNFLPTFLKKLSNITALKVDKRVLSTGSISLNPYQTNVDNSKLLSYNSFFRNSLFFDRLNPVFGLEINYQQSGSKILLTNGFDSRSNTENSLRLRWNFIRKTNFLIGFKQGYKRYLSELFSTNNYKIKFYEAAPEFSYQFNSNFKTTLSGALGMQQNAKEYGEEHTLNFRVSSEVKYNLLKKGVFSARLNSINNQFNGKSNSSVGYEMLDGLQPGNNLTWSVGFQRTISNGIQLNFTYEGRKSADIKAIHTGGMQVRAFF